MPKDNIEEQLKKQRKKTLKTIKLFLRIRTSRNCSLIETATDNNNRTVANIRSYFNKAGGNLSTSGSVEFMFEHFCNFRINQNDLEIEKLNWNLLTWTRKVFLDNNEYIYMPHSITLE